MAHALKPEFVFWRNGQVHLNRRGRQFSRLLAAEVCASAVVMLDTPWSEVVWRVRATHSIRQFPLHFSSRASPCAITSQLDSTRHQVVMFIPPRVNFVKLPSSVSFIPRIINTKPSGNSTCSCNCCCKIKNVCFLPHSIFMCFEWIVNVNFLFYPQ